MRRMTTALLTACLITCATPCVPCAQAQNAPIQAMPEGGILTIDFKGGTVEQYVAALRKAGKDVNIVTTERASKQVLAPLSLSQVSLGVAVYAIEAASTSSTGAWRIDSIAPPGPRMAFPPAQAYSVDFYPFGKRGEDLVVESYSLQRILKPDGKSTGLDAKVVMTAIETGLRMQHEGGEDMPDLRFHSDSGLLFVRGTVTDVRLVGSTVSRLMDDVKSQTLASQRRAQASALREIAMKEAKLEIGQREVELAMVQKELDRIRPLVEQGKAPASEASRLETEVARAKFNLERARLGLERAQLQGMDGGEPEPAAPAPAGGGGEQAPATKRSNAR